MKTLTALTIDKLYYGGLNNCLILFKEIRYQPFLRSSIKAIYKVCVSCKCLCSKCKLVCVVSVKELKRCTPTDVENSTKALQQILFILFIFLSININILKIILNKNYIGKH